MTYADIDSHNLPSIPFHSNVDMVATHTHTHTLLRDSNFSYALYRFVERTLSEAKQNHLNKQRQKIEMNSITLA